MYIIETMEDVDYYNLYQRREIDENDLPGEI